MGDWRKAIDEERNVGWVGVGYNTNEQPKPEPRTMNLAAERALSWLAAMIAGVQSK